MSFPQQQDSHWKVFGFQKTNKTTSNHHLPLINIAWKKSTRNIPLSLLLRVSSKCYYTENLPSLREVVESIVCCHWCCYISPHTAQRGDKACRRTIEGPNLM